MSITFTKAASEYIKAQIEKEQALGFRLSVKKTGCSGYSYVPTVITDVNPQDCYFALDNGVKIFIDPSWQHVLEGIVVDFVEETKSGLTQKRLTFTNPNESSRCGCGESFHIE